MTKEEMEQEYNRLVMIVGTAVIQRMLYLSSEIKKSQPQQQEKQNG